MSTRPRKRASRSSTPARRADRERQSPVSPGIRFRIDFCDRCSVGIGKVRLLEAIERCGSLSQAAREIGMSYRRAWLLIDSMHAEFDTPVVSATVGGSGGGGAKLTRFGSELVLAYRGLETALAALAAERMHAVAAHAVNRGKRPDSSGTAPRERIAKRLTGAD
jgi:molybdate transport system regulatory protein